VELDIAFMHANEHQVGLLKKIALVRHDGHSLV